MKNPIFRFGAVALCAALLTLGCGCRKSAPAPASSAPSEIENYTPAPVPADSSEMENLQNAIQQNPDTAAWLVVPGTDINEAVVQAADNDYYLRRNAQGEPDNWGCTFSDYINVLTSREALHPNSILYGHSHNSEDPDLAQFTQLFRYLDEDFLKENPAFYLYLPDGDCLTFQIAAVFYTDIGFDYIAPFPEKDYYAEVEARNEYQFENITIEPEDKLLTLSTCSYRYDVNNTHDHRFVVLGRLLEKGESPAAPDFSRNPEPKRPEA